MNFHQGNFGYGDVRVPTTDIYVSFVHCIKWITILSCSPRQCHRYNRREIHLHSFMFGHEHQLRVIKWQKSKIEESNIIVTIINKTFT